MCSDYYSKILSRLYDEEYCYLNAYFFFLPCTCWTRTKIRHGARCTSHHTGWTVKSIFTVLVWISEITAFWSSWNFFRRHRVTVIIIIHVTEIVDDQCHLFRVLRRRREFRFFLLTAITIRFPFYKRIRPLFCTSIELFFWDAKVRPVSYDNVDTLWPFAFSVSVVQRTWLHNRNHSHALVTIITDE